MRRLSELELRGLLNLASDADYDAGDNDPIIDAWEACVSRGVATCIDDGEFEYWDINDLGRLALRVHYAVTQGS